jgi:hypothetical protein
MSINERAIYGIILKGSKSMSKLKIRRNGEYYQVGYYLKGIWNQVHHIGTPEQLLKKLDIPLPEAYQNAEPK